MRQALLPPGLQHVYDRVLDNSVHRLCTQLCVELKAARPDLYATVLAEFHGSRRASVRCTLYTLLDRGAAMACVEFISAGASRVCASVETLGLLLTGEVLRKLLRCVLSAK